MAKYYANASPEEIAEAMAAMGIRNYGHNSTTTAAAIIGDKVRDVFGNLVEPTYTSDPDAHAEQLAHLAEITATPEREPFNARIATNREYVDYCSRNRIDPGQHAKYAALARPDERWGTASTVQQQPPTDDEPSPDAA